MRTSVLFDIGMTAERYKRRFAKKSICAAA
jgi:hypothetical protein